MLRFEEEVAERLANESRCIHSLLVAIKEVASTVVTSDATVHHLVRLVNIAEAEMERHVTHANHAMSTAENTPLISAVP